jgi:hypothetical protein
MLVKYVSIDGRAVENRRTYSDWLMKGVFFLPIFRFFSFSTIAGIFA